MLKKLQSENVISFHVLFSTLKPDDGGIPNRTKYSQKIKPFRWLVYPEGNPEAEMNSWPRSEASRATVKV